MTRFNAKARLSIPCLGCKDRVADPNCHDGCKLYAKYREELKEERDSMKQAAQDDEYSRSLMKKQGGRR